MVQESKSSSRHSPVRSWAAILAFGLGIGLAFKGIPNLGFLGHGLGIVLAITGFRLGATRIQCPHCNHVHYHFGTVRHCQHCGSGFGEDDEQIARPGSGPVPKSNSDSRSPPSLMSTHLPDRIVWTDDDLVAETEWSRTFWKQDGTGVFFQSKFPQGEAMITLSELAQRWPSWSESERHDFCNAVCCGDVRDKVDIFRFLATDQAEPIRSTIALGVALSLRAEEAYPILKSWANDAKIGHRANFFQAIAITRHPDALDTLQAEFHELSEHPDLFDDSGRYNFVALELVGCIQHLLQLGSSPDTLRPMVSKLRNHPCHRIRQQVKHGLSNSFANSG